jgi:hypothetical protein
MSFTTPKVEDFSDYGFAPGFVRGVRAFNITKQGILVGVVYRQWWLPGELRAACLQSGKNDKYHIVYNGGDGWDVSNDYENFPELDHSMENCRHGLYAFYDGSNDYHNSSTSRVSGVVEGYGEVMIGPRGFRASKAQIVALTLEDHVSFSGDQDELIRQNYSGIPLFDTFDQMIAEFPLGEYTQ